MLKDMTESGDRFKRLALMYIMSTILAPTTSTRISNRCYPVLERKKVETLVGQFASGMTCLLDNLVQGWTGLTPPESEEMARRFGTVTGGAPTRSRTARGRFEGYNYPSDIDDEDEQVQDSGESSDSDDDSPCNPGGGEGEGKKDGDNEDGGMGRDNAHEGQGSGNDGGGNNYDGSGRNDNDEAAPNDEPGDESGGGGGRGEAGDRDKGTMDAVHREITKIVAGELNLKRKSMSDMPPDADLDKCKKPRSTKMVLTKSTRPARRSPRFSPTKGGAREEDSPAGVPAIEKVLKKAVTKHIAPSKSSPRLCRNPDGAQNDDLTNAVRIAVKVTEKAPARRSPRVSRNGPSRKTDEASIDGASSTASRIPELAPRAHIKKQSADQARAHASVCRTNSIFDRLRSQLRAQKEADPNVADGHTVDDPKVADPKAAYHKAADGHTVVAASAPIGSAVRHVLIASPDPGVVTASGSRPVDAASPAVGTASRPVEIVSPVVGSEARPVNIVSPAAPSARPEPLPLKPGGVSVSGQAGAPGGELIDELSPTGQEAMEELVGLHTGMFPASLLFENRGHQVVVPKTSGRTKASVKLGLGRRSVVANRQSPRIAQQQRCEASAGTTDRRATPLDHVHASHRHPLAFTPPSCDLGFSLIRRQPSPPWALGLALVLWRLPHPQVRRCRPISCVFVTGRS